MALAFRFCEWFLSELPGYSVYLDRRVLDGDVAGKDLNMIVGDS